MPVGRKVKRTFTGPKAPLFINEPFTKRSRLAEETGEGDKTIREAPSKKIDSDLQTPNEADSRTGTKDNVVAEFDAGLASNAISCLLLVLNSIDLPSRSGLLISEGSLIQSPLLLSRATVQIFPGKKCRLCFSPFHSGTDFTREYTRNEI